MLHTYIIIYIYYFDYTAALLLGIQNNKKISSGLREGIESICEFIT
jgi:hypothetical protein